MDQAWLALILLKRVLLPGTIFTLVFGLTSCAKYTSTGIKFSEISTSSFIWNYSSSDPEDVYCALFFSVANGNPYALAADDIVTCNGTPMTLDSGSNAAHYYTYTRAPVNSQVSLIYIHQGFATLISKRVPSQEWIQQLLAQPL